VVAQLALYATLIPAALAGVAAALLTRVSALRGAGPALGFGVGYVASHLASSGWPGVVPDDAMHWLLHVTALASAAGQIGRASCRERV
jgi:hypothetical protein